MPVNLRKDWSGRQIMTYFKDQARRDGSGQEAGCFASSFLENRRSLRAFFLLIESDADHVSGRIIDVSLQEVC
jgi:hypothetical protein